MSEQRNLRIAMLGQKTVPARGEYRGGVEVVVEELSTRMAGLGHQVTCYNRSGCDNGNLRDYKIHLRSIKLKGVKNG